MNTQSGVVDTLIQSLGTTTGGTRKSLVFWVTEAVKMDGGAVLMDSLSATAITDTHLDLVEKDNTLNFLETDRNKWIEPIKTIMTVFGTELDLDKTPLRNFLTLYWDFIVSANKYLLLIKPALS